jgi:serine/threonine protein phosphatase PrpC
MMQRNASSLSYHSPTPTNQASAQGGFNSSETPTGTADRRSRNQQSVFQHWSSIHSVNDVVESDSDESVKSFNISDEEDNPIISPKGGTSGETSKVLDDWDLTPLVNGEDMFDDIVRPTTEEEDETLKSTLSYSSLKGQTKNFHLDFAAGFFEFQGHCEYMEDRTLLEPVVAKEGSTPSVSLFALLDGHNGSKCVDFVQANLLQTMLESKLLHSASFKDTLDSNKDGELLAEAFGILDHRFLSMAVLSDPLETSGSCVTAMMVRKNFVTLAWLGDCRAVMCTREGKAVQMTSDDNVKNDEELKRIEAAGGWIANKRVNGLIAVTRSIGDIEFKTLKNESWGKTFTGDLLVSTPHIHTFERKDERFVVIASDGKSILKHILV